jgi:quercetin dioxygenase-like cupin family protein
MSATATDLSSAIQLFEEITYAENGFLKKVLWQDNTCQYNLISLTSGTSIAEHTSPRNAVVQVLAGSGILTLEGVEIPLKPGVFVVMPAHAPHALEAKENLAFLLTLSDRPSQG